MPIYSQDEAAWASATCGNIHAMTNELPGTTVQCDKRLFFIGQEVLRLEDESGTSSNVLNLSEVTI